MEETKTVAEETKPVLLAGYAEAVVTPPMGVNIPGYFSVRLSNGVITDLHVRAGWMPGNARLDELEAFLDDHQEPVTDYDEGMVRRLIERITVYEDHLAFEFKSGLETEVRM